MTNRIYTALVSIAALASVLVVDISYKLTYIALVSGTCSTSGGGSTISNSCQATQINTNTNTGGVH